MVLETTSNDVLVRAVRAEVRAEQLTAVIERALARHVPVAVDRGEVVCGECSYQISLGRCFGKVVPYPCPTVLDLEGEPK